MPTDAPKPAASKPEAVAEKKPEPTLAERLDALFEELERVKAILRNYGHSGV